MISRQYNKFNRKKRISIIGGTGNDTLSGGPHTVFINGAAGDDTLCGGEAGATLDGGDGNDLVSANPVDLFATLTGSAAPFDAAGSVLLNGGAGDDAIIGNNLKTPDISDTLSGGDGNDTFYSFGSDQIVDLGDGQRSSPVKQPVQRNRASPSDRPLSPSWMKATAPPSAFVANHLGDNGLNSRIYVSDNSGTLTMQGPAGSTFLLGDLFNAAGYPFARVGRLAEIGEYVGLTVNGFPSTLYGVEITGYQINPGDTISLIFGFE